MMLRSVYCPCEIYLRAAYLCFHGIQLVPCVIIALIGHPRIPFSLFFTLLWALSNTIEAVSVLPQLRLIQNAKVTLFPYYFFVLLLVFYMQLAKITKV